MELTDQETGLIVLGLHALIQRDGGGGGAAWRLLARAAADPGGAPIAVQRPGLMRTFPPEVAVRVKAQAAKVARSKQAAGRPPLTASEAATVAQVTTRAIQAACANDKLTATRDKITGAWLVSWPDLAEWMETRRAAGNRGCGSRARLWPSMENSRRNDAA